MAEECTVLSIRYSSCSFCTGARKSQSTSLLLLPSQAAMHGSHLRFVPCMYKCVNPRAEQINCTIIILLYLNILTPSHVPFSALKQCWSSCTRMAICALHGFDNISLIHIDFLSRRPRLNLLGEVRPTSIAAPAPPFSLPTPPLPVFNSKIYRPPSSQCGHIYSSSGDT